jgi:hypothetical protein
MLAVGRGRRSVADDDIPQLDYATIFRTSGPIFREAFGDREDSEHRQMGVATVRTGIRGGFASADHGNGANIPFIRFVDGRKNVLDTNVGPVVISAGNRRRRRTKSHHVSDFTYLWNVLQPWS